MTHALVASGTLAVLMTLATPALAGPPLICHPFDIGTARSLPIGPADGGWSAIDRSYDTSRLVADTLGLLTPTTPVIVRIETLRRAAIYASDDTAHASRLLTALRKRATKSPSTRAEAMALFDVGYLVETYRQLGPAKRALSSVPDVAGGLDGYALVTRAMAVVTDDPAMHFAAALMTTEAAKAAQHRTHLRQARAATTDPLLARNLRTHFEGA